MMQTETEAVCQQGFNWWFRDHQGLGVQGVGKCRELSLKGWAGFGEVGGGHLGPGVVGWVEKQVGSSMVRTGLESGGGGVGSRSRKAREWGLGGRADALCHPASE